MSEKTKMQGILIPSLNDVLSGKGKGVHFHHGNKNYRAAIAKWKPEYTKTKTHKEKGVVASKVLGELKSLCPPAKFLTKQEGSDRWYSRDETAIISKIKQALREKSKSSTTQSTADDKRKQSNSTTNTTDHADKTKSMSDAKPSSKSATKVENAEETNRDGDSARKHPETNVGSEKEIKPSNGEGITTADWKELVNHFEH